MKVRRTAAWFALAVCITCFTGCGGVNFEFIGENTPRPDANADNAPLAVLAAAPSKTWFADVQAAWTGSTEIEEWSDKDLEQMMAGLDVQRPMAAFLYLSESGMAEPVIYLPVVDYDRFVDELAGIFKLRRAVASSFMIGQQKFLVKSVGDFAVIGTSLDRINGAPQSPHKYIGDMASEFDFAFKLLGDEFPRHEKLRLAEALSDTFGDAYEELVMDISAFSIGLNIDAETGYECRAALSPLPEDVDSVTNLLTETFGKWGVDVNAETKGQEMVCSLDVRAEHMANSWAQIEPVLTNMLESQRSMFASRSSRDPDEDELPMVFYVDEYEDQRQQREEQGDRENSR